MTQALSELEGCVLGHLSRRGPATAYAVRRAFLDSPSSHWSGSAGAVYPLLERLEARGLVRSRKAPTGARQAWLYAITPGGRRRLRAWLLPPFSADLVSTPQDPLRTRVHFLSLIPERQRAALFDAALAGLRRHLSALQALRKVGPDDRRALRGAVLAMRARIAWFAGLRREGARTRR